MAKKKNQGKKHRFKYAASSEVASLSVSSSATISSPVAQKRVVASTANIRDFSYVSEDLRRIAVWAGSLVALEVVLWYVFGHTGVGNSVYQLVQV